jgi:glycosyltransferase involved in cell wall biosynthesis
MMTPTVSIVIPCYNHGAFLPETLDSVDAQTFRDFEVIIVDDGSTDEITVQLLDRLEQPRCRVIRTVNRGVSAARNRGIDEAAGRFILPLDADDLIAPEYLARTVPILETQPNVAVVSGERQLFGERQGLAPLPAYDPRRLLVENLIYPAALFRKADWAAVGGYNEAMASGWEDWDFWVAMAQLDRRVVRLPDVLFHYRVCLSSRDHSLRFFRKLHMYALMVRRNRKLYLRHLPYVMSSLCRLHLLGRPAVEAGATKGQGSRAMKPKTPGADR